MMFFIMKDPFYGSLTGLASFIRIKEIQIRYYLSKFNDVLRLFLSLKVSIEAIQTVSYLCKLEAYLKDILIKTQRFVIYRCFKFSWSFFQNCEFQIRVETIQITLCPFDSIYTSKLKIYWNYSPIINLSALLIFFNLI